MTDTLMNIAPGCYIDPASVESVQSWPVQGWCTCGRAPAAPHQAECAGGPYHVVQVTTHGGRVYEHAGALADGYRYFDEADAIIDADKLAQLLMMPEGLDGSDDPDSIDLDGPYRLFAAGPHGVKTHAWRHTVFGGGGYRTECGAFKKTINRDNLTPITLDEARETPTFCQALGCQNALHDGLTK